MVSSEEPPATGRGPADGTGPIARIGPNALITANPDVWAHVHTTPGYKKTDWFYQAARFEYQRDNIFTQTNTEKHDIRRKQIAPGVGIFPRSWWRIILTR